MALPMVIAWGLLALLAGGVAAWAISLYNSLVQVKNNIGKAWENIDVLLLQRNEELPKLIAGVQAFAGYEAEIVRALTELRLAYGKAPTVSARTNLENRLQERLTALQAVAEGYPELKADSLYRQTQARISAIEENIADRRSFFNETVKIYNTQIEHFPELLLAGLMRYRRHPYLRAAQPTPAPPLPPAQP